MEMSMGLHSWPTALDTRAEKKDHTQLHNAAFESLVFCMVDQSGISRLAITFSCHRMKKWMLALVI